MNIQRILLILMLANGSLSLSAMSDDEFNVDSFDEGFDSSSFDEHFDSYYSSLESDEDIDLGTLNHLQQKERLGQAWNKPQQKSAYQRPQPQQTGTSAQTSAAKLAHEAALRRLRDAENQLLFERMMEREAQELRQRQQQEQPRPQPEQPRQQQPRAEQNNTVQQDPDVQRNDNECPICMNDHAVNMQTPCCKQAICSKCWNTQTKTADTVYEGQVLEHGKAKAEQTCPFCQKAKK